MRQSKEIKFQTEKYKSKLTIVSALGLLSKSQIFEHNLATISQHISYL